MQRNHRRKFPKHANERYLIERPYHLSLDPRGEYARQLWKKWRQRDRRLIHHEKWDELPTKVHRIVRYDML